jgi:hypothetical protein
LAIINLRIFITFIFFIHRILNAVAWKSAVSEPLMSKNSRIFGKNIKTRIMVRRFLLFSVSLLCVFASKSQNIDSLKITEPKLYPGWTFWVPGATHFYDGRTGMGIFFATLEVGGTAAGIVYNNKLKETSNSPYYNYPLYFGLNAMGVDKCDFVRNRLQYLKHYRSDFKYDDISFNQLITAPFKSKNIFKPITGIFIALAATELYLESRNAEFSYRKVDKFRVINRYVDKNRAIPYYSLASMGMSWEAGVGEEYLFRNFILPVYDYRFGQKKGLLMSSALFGGMHAFNYLFVDKPNPRDIISQVAFTSIMGWALGKSVQNNNYHIGPAIAAHTWYDFVLMAGSFIINPKDNVFGIDVKLKL